MVRGITIGLLVIVVSAFFSPLPFTHPLIILLFLILSSLLFSLAGLVNGIYAKSFDGITIVPTFVLTPLVYLGGVFYSAQALPPLWQKLTFADPIFYLINGFRAGFMGFSDISLSLSIGVLAVLIAILVGINWYFIRTGLGLRQ